MKKLKPCPKCLKIVSNPHLVSIDSWSGYATCLNCQLSTDVFYDDSTRSWKTLATEAWNRIADNPIQRRLYDINK